MMFDLVKNRAQWIIDNLHNIVGGHNGPYFDEEPPSRVISHYIVLLCAYGTIEANSAINDAIKVLADRLSSKEFRPYGFTYFCRDKRIGNEKINGVIGQAWVIEGLVTAYRFLGNKHYLSVAEELFLLHPFDSKNRLWHRVELDGTILSPDTTFNHQLWFAASGAMILAETGNITIKKNVSIFIDNIENILKLRNNGIIRHQQPVWRELKKRARCFISSELMESFAVITSRPNMIYKEIGYHLFNLYGFALLRENFGEHTFFKSNKLRKALAFIFTEEYINGLKANDHSSDVNVHQLPEAHLACNRYGYSYNAPGFGIPFVCSIFHDIINSTDIVNKFMDAQMSFTYDYKNQSFCNNTEDEITLNARLYEYARIFLRR